LSGLPDPGFGPFRSLAEGVGLGVRPPTGWLPLGETDLVVLVGPTGVGKTTTLSLTLARLRSGGRLPDRRALTDLVIIGAGRPVADRVERFALTRRFRERRPGGMSAILAAISVDPRQHAQPLLFDGLRGEAEVTHALALLPQARFIGLTASYGVRLSRLLGRADPFDRVEIPASGAGVDGDDDAILEEARNFLQPAEIEALKCAIAAGDPPISDIRAKLAIIREEQSSYEPGGALAALRSVAGDRSLIIDTGTLDPAGVAARAAAFVAGAVSRQAHHSAGR
jgi:hypothetical protein